MLAAAEPERYRTIVADPPWHYDKAGGYSWRTGRPSGETRPMLSYGTMSTGAIAGLPVAGLAAADAHLYLWTTQRYLWDAREIVAAWGFAPIKLLTWCKAPRGFSVGPAIGNASEFVIWARRGRPQTLARVPRDWWQWKRGKQSAKPEQFQAIVEQVSPGPYLELFARRARPGWDCWGDEAPNPIDWNPAPLKTPVLQGD